MTTTVRNLMFTHSRPPMDIDNDRTTSRKPWTEAYAPFHQQYVRIWQPQVQAIERFLGPGNSPSDADFIGLDTPAYHLNIFPQLVSSEGDVTRDFDQNIIPSVALAFSGNSALSILRSDPRQAVPGAPALWSRSLVGSTTSKIVDYQFTMSHSIPSLERAAAIGEMKKPRVIQRSEWLFEDNVGGVTARLQQELRGYAHVYDCPQVFLFDSNTLVIVQFQASSVDDIEREDCPIDVCVIPREQDPYVADQCTIQYALYWLIWRGWKPGREELLEKQYRQKRTSHYKGLHGHTFTGQEIHFGVIIKGVVIVSIPSGIAVNFTIANANGAMAQLRYRDTGHG